MKKIYCSEVASKRKPTGFDGVVLYHGFNAFFSGKPYEYKFNQLMKNPQREICTSTSYLGMMGVTIEGEILVASSDDLCSDVDENGRFFYESDMDSIVYDYADLDLHIGENDENNEIIIKNTKITGIWITSDANNNLKALAKMLAEKHNLPLIEMGESIFN